MTALFWVVFGAVLGIVLMGTFAAMAYMSKSEKRAMIRRLGNPAAGERRSEPAVPVLYDSGGPDAKKPLMRRVPGLDFLGRQITAAGLEWKPEFVLAAMAGLGVLGMIAGGYVRVLIFPEISAAALALVFAWLPYLYIAHKRNKRLAAFEGQFPDTLDFIARAVRAGHALSVSLELLANEAPEPTRTEFRRVFTEHNLGAPLTVALSGLIQRVPLVDARFFVSAVLLQRETGGNLSEILSNLGDVIRERFQLKGRVRAASAHGRVTATALTIIPIALLLILSLIRPDYLNLLKEDFHGRLMLFGAVIGQILGYLSMKKIINIKV
jgi:tight adherence protein B